MYINDSSNKAQSIYHNVLFSLGLENTDTTTYPVDDFIRSINNWYRRVNQWVWNVTGEWEFDDSNYTTLPSAKADLVDGQTDYLLPSYAQKIDRVQIKDINCNWIKVNPIDKSQIGSAVEEFYKTKGKPLYYDMVGRSFNLYPAASSTECITGTGTKGLEIFFSREINEFASTDTTASPGFNEDFQEILICGAIIDFPGVEEKKKAEMINRIKEIKGEAESFYGSNQREEKPHIKPKYSRRK